MQTETIKQAVQRSGISQSRLYELLVAGKISAVKASARTLIVSQSLTDYLANLPPWKPGIQPQKKSA